MKRVTEAGQVNVAIRLIDETILVGRLQAGLTGRLETLLAGDVKFLNFTSKHGHRRFIAQHQIASIEELVDLDKEITLEAEASTSAHGLLGVSADTPLVLVTEALDKKMATYDPEKWSAPGMPAEFGLYAEERCKQFQAAFTVIRAELLGRPKPGTAKRARLFGASPEPVRA